MYKGIFPKSGPVEVAEAAPPESNSRVTTVELRPLKATAPASKKLTLRSLIERNRLEAVQRFREPARRPQRRAVHTVSAGETVYSISRRYGVDIDSLARTNDLDASYRIRLGQELNLPRPGAVVAANRPAPATEGEERAPRPSALNGALPPRAGSFRWPLRGKLLAGYGPQPGGQHNDGINIGAPAGTLIVASEAGIVAYVGDDLDTLGNLVLIRHAGGWVTAYAHNDTVIVRRGMRVARGEVISLTGATGNVDRPQLHFEIRKETEVVDPLELLRDQTASRDR